MGIENVRANLRRLQVIVAQMRIDLADVETELRGLKSERCNCGHAGTDSGCDRGSGLPHRGSPGSVGLSADEEA